MNVPFSRPSISDLERRYVRECLEQCYLSGDGEFTKRCHAFLETHYNTPVLLTHSATAALEMAVILAGVGPGDEVIMPSFTFVSTANAVVLRGGVPVFVDVDAMTWNIDPACVEAAITAKTKVVLPVHYAGVGCDMEPLTAIANRQGLRIVEDAAQGYLASRGGVKLGCFGALGCISFHATKNVVSGEGGALIINDRTLLERAQILREKGTNRTSFLRQEVAKYEWLDIGSSYLPGDVTAALLLAQLERGEELIARRVNLWKRYALAFRPLAEEGLLQMSSPPKDAAHNGHIFLIKLPTEARARTVLDALKRRDFGATTHYVPLHSTPAGVRFGRVSGNKHRTDDIARTMVRLPLFSDLSELDQDNIIAAAIAALREAA
jgi:dTDP-4-amino-4,6-dideoxygalactose transaminase